MKTLKVIRSVFGVVGAGLLIGAFVQYQNAASFVSAALKADGTVVRLQESRSSDSTNRLAVAQSVDRRSARFRER